MMPCSPGRRRADQASGFERNRSSPSCCERNFATSWPLTLLPAASSGGANVPRPPLPGETVTMPPPIPLLPGSPMSYSQSPEVSYRPGGRHHGERVVADQRVDQALLGQRVDAAVGQGRAHHRQILGADVERALPGVEVGRLGRVDVDPLVALQQAGDALVAEVRGRRRGVDLVVERQGPAGEPGQAVMDELPPGLGGRARHEAGRRDRARVHHRVGPAVRAPFDRARAS